MATRRATLGRFQLEGVRDTGRKAGDGSYATVKELEFRGLKCVGKKLHDILFESATPREKAAMLERFETECELLSHLHHPCIVQFMGVYFEGGSQLPVLVMEFLLTNLSACLDRYGVLPDQISYGILRDVALGLRYLHEHSPPIIHRDLSANNVLLTSSMSAKISDLGVAKILNLSPATQMTQTQTPGTPCYMPPEAMVARPKYTKKVDIFSYGVMLAHVFSGQWPIPGEAFGIDPNNPNSIIPLSEFDRRREFIEIIGLQHPMIGLIRQCLNNISTHRPEAFEIVAHIDRVLGRLQVEETNKIETLRQLQSLQAENESLRGEFQSSQAENESLRGEFQSSQAENESLRGEFQSSQAENESLRGELQSSQAENESLRGELQSSRADNESLRGELQSSRAEIESLRGELQSSQAEKESSQAEVESLRAEVQRLSLQTPDKSPKTTQQGASIAQDQPHLLPSIEARLEWKRCADLPVGISRACCIVMEGKVYVGGGVTNELDHTFLLHQYNPARDKWSTLPRCPVFGFGLGQLSGELLLVGGTLPDGTITGKVYRYKERSREWEEHLRPMPTPRVGVAVIATQSALVTCGGVTGIASHRKPISSNVVEVYNKEESQWYRADPLPFASYFMPLAIINNTAYLGGARSDSRLVVCAPIASLVRKPSSRQSPHTSVWKRLPDLPLTFSTLSSLNGALIAIGGEDQHWQNTAAVHVFLPLTNSWVRVKSGDLPEALFACSAIELSPNKVFVVGGQDEEGKEMETVFMGSIAV